MISSCEDNPTPRAFFGRPLIEECITLIQDGATIGMMACNGKIVPIPSKLTVIRTQKNVEEMKKYYGNREFGHYKCVKFRRRCKK